MSHEEGFGIAGGFAVLVEDLKRENGSPYISHRKPSSSFTSHSPRNEWHE
jgi:hypothetical protein